MALSSSRDNWERLVAAVVKKEQIWQLCHQDSISTIASDFTDGILSSSSNSLRPVSPSPSPQLSLTNNSVVEDRKNASKTITQKLFSALLWRRKATYYDLDQGLVGISEDYLGLRSFSLHELLVATANFSNKNVLGHRGHSTVYKGRLADGSLVAVKRLRKRVAEKELEMENLVAHRNVLRLRGFCISQKEQLLIYPFMENGSVASHLRERPEMQPPLGWQVRKTIALGVAKGLAYLHHECIKCIIHGDVKAANILLDENFEAVVADFTLAQFLDFDDGVVRGTIGHIAPEYLSRGKCSEKTDVYGYGAFLLELITGQRASDLARCADDDGMTLLDWVKNICEKRINEVLVDSNLQWAFVEEEVKELLQMAAVCTQNDPEERPTMLEVVRMLEVVGMLEDGDDLAKRWEEFLVNDFRNENSHGIGWNNDDGSFHRSRRTIRPKMIGQFCFDFHSESISFQPP